MVARNLLVALALASLLGSVAPLGASAQSTGKKSGSVSGSPLDTLLSTRLWTTPPPAQDFVKESRPDSNSLEYTPLTGKDPERPKPRDASNIKALQAELEGEIQKNLKRAKGLGGVSAPDAKKSARKPILTTKSAESR